MDDQRKDQPDANKPPKGTALNNYRLMMCLQMIWKIVKTQIKEEIYYWLKSRGLFPEEQKG